MLGGWLIEHVSWRAVFFINLPIALLIVLISLRHVAESSDEEKARVDWIGAILAVLGLAALVYGLIESSRLGFADRSVVTVLILAGVLLVAFVIVEARSRHPMLPLALFRSPVFAGTNLLTFLLYAALSGTLFFLPLNLIQVQHYSPTTAGAVLLPFIIIMSSLSRWSGGLVVRYGPKLPLVIGPSIAAVGYALFMLPGVGGSYWTNFFPPMVVVGLGMAISVAPLTTTVMSSVPQERAGLASGVNNAVARGASLLAIAVIGAAAVASFSARFEDGLARLPLAPQVRSELLAQKSRLAALEIPHSLSAESRSAVEATVASSFRRSFRLALLLAAALALASAVVGVATIREKRRE